MKQLIAFWFEFSRFVEKYDDNMQMFSHLDVEDLIQTFKEKRALLQQRHHQGKDETLMPIFTRDSDGNVNWH